MVPLHGRLVKGAGEGESFLLCEIQIRVPDIGLGDFLKYTLSSSLVIVAYVENWFAYMLKITT